MGKPEKKQNSSPYSERVILFENDEEITKKVWRACRKINVDLLKTDTFEDIIAVPSYFCIINQELLDDTEWHTLASYLKEVNDSSVKILLTGKPRKPSIPTANRVAIKGAITDEALKFMLLKTREKIQKRKGIEEKALTRVLRLMQILKTLNDGDKIRALEMAEELEVSKRTIQRDISLLNTAGFIIMQDEQGRHYFPEGYDMFKDF